jgi:hypothetical protein
VLGFGYNCGVLCHINDVPIIPDQNFMVITQAESLACVPLVEAGCAP